MTPTEKRIASTQNAIEKLRKKLERVQVALETGKNPYYYSDYDLRVTTRELADAERKLAEYQEALVIEQSIEKIPAIEAFLDKWKEMAAEWHKKDLERLTGYYKDYNGKVEQCRAWVKDNGLHSHWDREKVRAKETELGIDYKTHKMVITMFNTLTLKLYECGPDWEEYLDRELEKEKANKRRMLLERVKGITGEITDAAGLMIDDRGEINGYVYGKKGTAKVTTISAGGYNIQCFHFRVLVKAL